MLARLLILSVTFAQQSIAIGNYEDKRIPSKPLSTQSNHQEHVHGTLVSKSLQASVKSPISVPIQVSEMSTGPSPISASYSLVPEQVIREYPLTRRVPSKTHGIKKSVQTKDVYSVKTDLVVAYASVSSTRCFSLPTTKVKANHLVTVTGAKSHEASSTDSIKKDNLNYSRLNSTTTSAIQRTIQIKPTHHASSVDKKFKSKASSYLTRPKQANPVSDRIVQPYPTRAAHSAQVQSTAIPKVFVKKPMQQPLNKLDNQAYDQDKHKPKAIHQGSRHANKTSACINKTIIKYVTVYQALPVASAIKKYFTAFPTKIAQPKAIQPVLTTPTKSIKQPIQTVASKPEPKLKPSSKPSPNLVNTLPVTHSKDTYVEHDTKTTMIVSPVHSSGKNNAATKSVVHSAVHPSPSPTTSKINTQYKVKASKSEY